MKNRTASDQIKETLDRMAQECQTYQAHLQAEIDKLQQSENTDAYQWSHESYKEILLEGINGNIQDAIKDRDKYKKGSAEYNEEKYNRAVESVDDIRRARQAVQEVFSNFKKDKLDASEDPLAVRIRKKLSEKLQELVNKSDDKENKEEGLKEIQKLVDDSIKEIGSINKQMLNDLKAKKGIADETLQKINDLKATEEPLLQRERSDDKDAMAPTQKLKDFQDYVKSNEVKEPLTKRRRSGIDNFSYKFWQAIDHLLKNVLKRSASTMGVKGAGFHGTLLNQIGKQHKIMHDEQRKVEREERKAQSAIKKVSKS